MECEVVIKSAEIGKFASGKWMAKNQEIVALHIVGDAVKMEDMCALNEWLGNAPTPLAEVIFEQAPASPLTFEGFLVGRCSALGRSLAVMSPLSKEGTDLAKKAGVEIIRMGQGSAKKPAKQQPEQKVPTKVAPRTPKEKTPTTASKTPKPAPSEKKASQTPKAAEAKQPAEKAKPVEKVKTQPKAQTKAQASAQTKTPTLDKAISGSKEIPAATKALALGAFRNMLVDAIQKSASANIDLGFQLTIAFGEEAKAIQRAITPYLAQIKKEIGS